MLYYHGSPTGGLTTLLPHASEHGKPLVYLSLSKPVAALYLWKRPYTWYTYGFDPQGVPVYTESFPGQLRRFYHGLSGYLYTCEGDFSSDNPTGIPVAAVSEKPVPVSGCERVTDALVLLQACAAQGSLRLRYYEELTPEEKQGQRRMIAEEIRRLRLWQERSPLAEFIKGTFPSVWEETLRSAGQAGGGSPSSPEKRGGET
ncbi:MAG TPA: hypothetical protein H9674_04010 [Firmicutes bacterium]|nr:hypothetical protein [Bacillota bacterium]